MIEMALKLLFFAANSQISPSSRGFCTQVPFVIRLSCIGLFSTGPKLDNFCAKKFSFGSIHSVFANSWLRFWSHSLLKTDFSSDCKGRKQNELVIAAGHIRLLFQHEYKIFKIAHSLKS